MQHFKTKHLNENKKIQLKTIQNIKTTKEYKNNMTLSQTPIYIWTLNDICIHIYTYVI